MKTGPVDKSNLKKADFAEGNNAVRVEFERSVSTVKIHGREIHQFSAEYDRRVFENKFPGIDLPYNC